MRVIDYDFHEIQEYKDSWTPEMTFRIGKTCQDKIDHNIYSNRAWIRLERILQSSQGIAVIKGILDQGRDIVLKVNSISQTIKEYNIARRLKDTPGFIHYLCYFVCNELMENLIQNDNLRRDYICESRGESMGILLMMYYRLESLNKNSKLYNEKSIRLQILLSMFCAYENHGIILQDNHLGNILLKRSSRKHSTYNLYNKVIKIKLNGIEIRICDFEKSIVIHERTNATDKIFIITMYDTLRRLNALDFELESFSNNLEDIFYNILKSLR